MKKRQFYLCTSRFGQSQTEVIRNSEVIIHSARKVSAKSNRPIDSPILGNASFNLGTEMAHETLDRPSGSVSQSADSTAFNLFAEKESDTSKSRTKDIRQLEKHVDFSLVATSLDHTVHHVHHPCRTLTTRRALTTRLVLVELRETGNGSNDIGALVHDDDSTRSKTTLSVLERIIIHPKTMRKQ